jgi:antitoxin HicB
MLFSYPVDLEDCEDGRVLARITDLPGCVTDGADRAEALAEAADALEEWLAFSSSHKIDIPVPSQANGRPLAAPCAVISAKVALYLAMRETGTSNVGLATRLGCVESEVRRMLDMKHATKIGRLEQALAALGRRVVISVEAA